MAKKLNLLTDAFIVGIGEEKHEGTNAIGGDKRLLKLGFKYEVALHPEDIRIACQTLEMARCIQAYLNQRPEQ